MDGDQAPIGILIVSDRAFRGEYEDRGGPAVKNWLEGRFSDPPPFVLRLVPDDIDTIEQEIQDLGTICSLVVTTGGTGIGPRDFTPEATKRACSTMIPGFGEKMRAASWEAVPTAILSRSVAGLIGTCLVVNLPGNPKAIGECLEAIWSAIPHAIEIAGGPSWQARGAARSPHPPSESKSS
ncbi:MAG TPA: molybdopterin adenylyltransferase [Planctomycetes bacterium]|nr:molybdopterin adenylyltransferase [Planctomycetota bacterium]